MERRRKWIIFNEINCMLYIINFPQPVREDKVLFIAGLDKGIVIRYTTYENYLEISDDLVLPSPKNSSLLVDFVPGFLPL